MHIDDLRHEDRRTARRDAAPHGAVRTAVVSSVITTAALLAAAYAGVAANRDAISEYLLASGGPAAGTGRPIAAEEASIITTVEGADPAVVSIAILEPAESAYAPYYDGLGPFTALVPGYTDDVEVGGGSGFIVSPDGLIITNKHVVENENAKLRVVTSSGDEHEVDVVATDPFFDIAFLKIKGGGPFPYLEFGDSDDIRVGQTVIAIGNALSEFRNSVSVGVVSGLARSVVAGSYGSPPELLEHVIQTDAAINPGNSGGPLMGTDGKVIGVNVAIAADSENIGFALPGNIAKDALESVRERGEVVRPYLGVRSVSITPEFRKARSISVERGALVSGGDGDGGEAVVPESPASKAGVREGDIILDVDGETIGPETSLAQLIRTKKVGDTVTLTILRDGRTERIDVVLEEAPRNI